MKTLLNELRTLYGMPTGDKPEEAYRILAGQLSGFPDHLSKRSLQLILQKQRNQYFPAPSVIVQAVREAASEEDKTARRTASRQAKPDHTRTAENLIRSEMGRTAAAQGWIGQLFDFARKTGRLPEPSEQAKLMHQARQFDELYEQTKQKFADLTGREKPRSFDAWIALSEVSAQAYRRQLDALETFLIRREQLSEIANAD